MSRRRLAGYPVRFTKGAAVTSNGRHLRFDTTYAAKIKPKRKGKP